MDGHVHSDLYPCFYTTVAPGIVIGRSVSKTLHGLCNTYHGPYAGRLGAMGYLRPSPLTRFGKYPIFVGLLRRSKVRSSLYARSNKSRLIGNKVLGVRH